MPPVAALAVDAMMQLHRTDHSTPFTACPTKKVRPTAGMLSSSAE